jgi:hypothetical protein
MLRITDRESTQVFNLPYELAQQIGVFKDMLDVVQDTSDGNDQPVLFQTCFFQS